MAPGSELFGRLHPADGSPLGIIPPLPAALCRARHGGHGTERSGALPRGANLFRGARDARPGRTPARRSPLGRPGQPRPPSLPRPHDRRSSAADRRHLPRRRINSPPPTLSVAPDAGTRVVHHPARPAPARDRRSPRADRGSVSSPRGGWGGAGGVPAGALRGQSLLRRRAAAGAGGEAGADRGRWWVASWSADRDRAPVTVASGD